MKAHDLLKLMLVSLFLLAIGALATFVPALHASRIDTMASLRQEHVGDELCHVEPWPRSC